MIKLTQNTKLFTTVNHEIDNRPDLKKFISGRDSLHNIFSLPTDISKERVAIYRKAYFGIGNTDCYKINLPNDNRLYLKMEYANAMGNNHYSRYWLVHLFICETLGILIPKETKILEVTSGSSGIALSQACELLDFEVTILVPELLPENRIKPMRGANTTIIKVDGYVDECIKKLRELLGQDDYYVTNHSEEKADIITYVFSRIGQEIVRDIAHPIDYAILAMGNGTSTYAIANEIKKKDAHTKIIAYRPHFEKNPKDIVFGLIAANIECRHISDARSVIDEVVHTTGIDLTFLKKLYANDTEISNLGPSSLYGIYLALQLTNKVNNKKIVTLGYDKIDRY